jgi:demethoxyubiquinone hydroxylase (CLK1/Coq7/Cat5 family)
MSANIYTPESLLIGKAYRSKSLEGIIQDAEKHDAWYGRGVQAYLVRVRPSAFSPLIKDTYRVVAVGEID